MATDINFFGYTTFRGERKRFGIKVDDRRRHFYVIGKTGMGKSELLKNMAVQDIQEGRGMGFIDPHGEAVDFLLDFIPKERVKDVIYINPADTEFPIAFNVMEQVPAMFRHLVASGLMSVFEKIWPEVWSERMKYILNNTILALLEYPDSTLLGINRMLADPEYRQKVVDNLTDPVIKTFWTQEYARYTQRYEVEATAAIQNKIGQFISNPLIRNILGQTRSTIDMREAMDTQKIFIVNLSKGTIGEDNSRLLGAMIITKLQLAAMSRVNMPEQDRKDFFLYIDEFQNFATESFVNILSEARKYRLSLILGHQYIAQLDETVRDAVFGNAGTLVSFRVGADDAETLEKEFSPTFLMDDFVNLNKYHIYVKLMIDGIAGHPFSAETLPPPDPMETSFRADIIKWSRERYGTPIATVEGHIAAWAGVSQSQAAAVPAVLSPVPARDQQPLYDAVCSKCQKPTKVVFLPDGKRPVYCKTCRKKAQQHESSVKKSDTKAPVNVAQAPKEAEVSLSDVLSQKPVLFHPSQAKQEEKPSAQPISKSAERSRDLRGAIARALEKKEHPAVEKQTGEIAPGETVYFSNDDKAQ